jgi:hypothetical protein
MGTTCRDQADLRLLRRTLERELRAPDAILPAKWSCGYRFEGAAPTVGHDTPKSLRIMPGQTRGYKAAKADLRMFPRRSTRRRSRPSDERLDGAAIRVMTFALVDWTASRVHSIHGSGDRPKAKWGASALMLLMLFAGRAIPGSDVDVVTVEAQKQRKLIEHQISQFVSSITVRGGKESLGRWQQPICPLVAGLSRDRGWPLRPARPRAISPL